jgi:hypothetical protein
LWSKSRKMLWIPNIYLVKNVGGIMRSLRTIHKNMNQTQEFSMRTVEYLQTKFAESNPTSYFLDHNGQFVPYEKGIHRSDVTYVNLAAVYNSHMKRYSKMFFDPFARGTHAVRYKDISFDICKFNYFLFAHRYKVFDFLEHSREIIRTRPHKRQKRHTAVLAPIKIMY